MNLARIGNKYIAETEPWKLWKTDPKRVETILYISLQLVANLSIAFEPFLPFSSKKLREMINMTEYDWSELGSTDLLPAVSSWQSLSCSSRRLRMRLSRPSCVSWKRLRRLTKPLPTRLNQLRRTFLSKTSRSLISVLDISSSAKKVKKSKKLLTVHYRRWFGC